MRYEPPRLLYVLTSHPFAYAEGYTLNFRFASAFTRAYNFLLVGTGLFLAVLRLLLRLTAI